MTTRRVVVSVDCDGGTHRVEFTAPGVRCVDHEQVSAHLVLAAFGSATPPCVKVVELAERIAEHYSVQFTDAGKIINMVGPQNTELWMDAGFRKPQEIGPWVDDRVGLRICDCWTWHHYGFTPRSARPWVDMLTTPATAAALSAQGLTVSDVHTWRDAGFENPEIIEWCTAGFTNPNDAAAWHHTGSTPSMAARWRDRGDVSERARKLAGMNVAPDAVLEPDWVEDQPFDVTVNESGLYVTVGIAPPTG